MLLISLWLVYYFLHSLLASSQIKEWAEKRMGKFFRFYRLGYNMISGLGFAVIAGIQFFLPDIALVPGHPLLSLAGIVVMISGMATGYIAFSRYDSREFFGLNQTVQTETPPRLVTEGLNQYVRHPLYFATILILAGYLLLSFTVNTAIFVAVSLIYLFIGTKLEERKLEKIYGEAYIAYKRKVKMFIPFIV